MSSELFWDSAPIVSVRAQAQRPAASLPPYNTTRWRPISSVSDLPSLRDAKIIALDTETCDPELTTKGPGVRRGAFIAGVAVGTDDGFRTYLPIAHDVGKEQNLDREHVLAWLRDNLGGNQTKIGANILYDLDMLAEAGVHVGGDIHDVQIADPLIDENLRHYNLGALAQRWLGEDKVDEELYGWAALAYGGQPNRRDQAQNIWRCPPSIVGPYAEGDVDLPLRIFAKQQTVLRQQELMELYDVERSLVPMLLAMRRRGVRVDVASATTLDERLAERAAVKRALLDSEGVNANNSGGSLAAYCDRKGIKYPRTPQSVKADGRVSGGNPSFQGDWLEQQHDDVLKAVHEVRRLEKHGGTFLQGHILGHQLGGRIHCQFHPLRSDRSGAVSGRFSSSDPNLQNIPVRDEELGPLIRSMFLPEEGEDWASDDYSQIEYRFLVHYGRGASADAARERYRNDPATDFHKFVAELSQIPRGPAKNINFGLVYGMGKETLASNLGRTLAEAEPIFAKYHETFPFIRELYEDCSTRARNRGHIMTALGRRRRFQFWEPRDWDESRKVRDKGPFTRDQAVAMWGENNIRRAYTHKALNALLQGSAADLMKKAMSMIWKSGVCQVLGAPLLTVHDELAWSRARTQAAVEAHAEAVRIMRTCLPLRVPVLVSSGIGANWGTAH